MITAPAAPASVTVPAAATFAIVAPAPPAHWIPVGVSRSRLRVFVDRAGLREAGGHRFARVRIGSPGAIVGAIVLVYQDEEIDCRARRWRLTGFEAQDADGKVVRREKLPPAQMLAANAGSIGGEVVATVCAF